MKNHQPPNGKKNKKPQHKWILILGVILLGALLGGIFHHHLQTSAQNKTFKDTQSWLQGVMDEVAAQIPEGKRVSETFCHRSSVKYGQGERECVVRQLETYKTSIEAVEQKKEQVHIAIVNAIDEQSVLVQNHILANQISTYKFGKNGLDCFISYYSLNDEDGTSYSPKLTETMTGLLVSASCSGSAMADYFPSRE
jgi:hypothetical protein